MSGSVDPHSSQHAPQTPTPSSPSSASSARPTALSSSAYATSSLKPNPSNVDDNPGCFTYCFDCLIQTIKSFIIWICGCCFGAPDKPENLDLAIPPVAPKVVRCLSLEDLKGDIKYLTLTENRTQSKIDALTEEALTPKSFNELFELAIARAVQADKESFIPVKALMKNHALFHKNDQAHTGSLTSYQLQLAMVELERADQLETFIKEMNPEKPLGVFNEVYHVAKRLALAGKEMPLDVLLKNRSLFPIRDDWDPLRIDQTNFKAEFPSGPLTRADAVFLTMIGKYMSQTDELLLFVIEKGIEDSKKEPPFIRRFKASHSENPANHREPYDLCLDVIKGLLKAPTTVVNPEIAVGGVPLCVHLAHLIESNSPVNESQHDRDRNEGMRLVANYCRTILYAIITSQKINVMATNALTPGSLKNLFESPDAVHINLSVLVKELMKNFALFYRSYNNTSHQLQLAMVESESADQLQSFINSIDPSQRTQSVFEEAYPFAKMFVFLGREMPLDVLLKNRSLFPLYQGHTGEYSKFEMDNFLREDQTNFREKFPSGLGPLTRADAALLTIIGKHAPQADELLLFVIEKGVEQITKAAPYKLMALVFPENRNNQPHADDLCLEVIRGLLEAPTTAINPEIAVGGGPLCVHLAHLIESNTPHPVENAILPHERDQHNRMRLVADYCRTILYAVVASQKVNVMATDVHGVHATSYLAVRCDKVALDRIVALHPAAFDPVAFQDLYSITLFETSQLILHYRINFDGYCNAYKHAGGFTLTTLSALDNVFTALLLQRSKNEQLQQFIVSYAPAARQAITDRVLSVFCEVYPNMPPELRPLIAGYYPFGIQELEDLVKNADRVITALNEACPAMSELSALIASYYPSSYYPFGIQEPEDLPENDVPVPAESDSKAAS